MKGFSAKDVFRGDVPDFPEKYRNPCWGHPKGFCTWAFSDVFRDLAHLQRGGDFPWVGKPGTMFSSSTDGRKTVVLELERQG